MFVPRLANVFNKHASVASNFRCLVNRNCSKYEVDFTKEDKDKIDALKFRVSKRLQIHKGSTLSEAELDNRVRATKNPFQLFSPDAPDFMNKDEFSWRNPRQWFDKVKVDYDLQSQNFIPERHETLGCELAAAHFVAFRGGRVKCKGHEEWMKYEELPQDYEENFAVTALDFGEFKVNYDGLDSIGGLNHLEWLSLKGSAIDDWSLDKISGEYSNLKYLDISDCENISERGLECLYRMFELEKLIVTNHQQSVAFELTCLMLEDCNPKLTCEINLPEKKSVEK